MSDGVKEEAARNLREAAKRAIEVGVETTVVERVVEDARLDIVQDHTPEQALNLGAM